MNIVKNVALALALVVIAVPASAKIKGPTLQDRQQAACASDAQRLCKDAIPDIDKVTACMESKKSQVSKGCAAMWDVKD